MQSQSHRGHVASILLDNAELFSKMIVPVLTLSSPVWGFLILPIFTNTWYWSVSLQSDM